MDIFCYPPCDYWALGTSGTMGEQRGAPMPVELLYWIFTIIVLGKFIPTGLSASGVSVFLAEHSCTS